MSKSTTINHASLNPFDKVSSEPILGKTADGKTVTPNGNETFKTEAFREIHTAILTDIKNLNKARKVTWNDRRGKTGARGIRQIFSNIKHNIRASRIGKKGELKASEQLKTDIEQLVHMLEETVIDWDLKNDFKVFYNELKGKHAGGYADTKEKLTVLIDNNDADGSLKADVEKFLRGYIPDNDEKLDVGNLAERFGNTSEKVDSKAEEQKNKFKTLLESYESKLPRRKLRNEINKLLENELRDEACERVCRNIDGSVIILLKHIEAFAKADYDFSGVTRVDLGDYYADYATDGDTKDTVPNARQTAFEHLKKEFQNAFPNVDNNKFASLLKNVFSKKGGTVKQLKDLVNDAATAQKEKVKNEKPVPQKSSEFLRKLPSCLNREPEGEDQYDTLTGRTLEMFDKSFQGFGKTREKLKFLCNACERETESDFSIFNRLERALEKIGITEDTDMSSADKKTERNGQYV